MDDLRDLTTEQLSYIQSKSETGSPLWREASTQLEVRQQMQHPVCPRCGKHVPTLNWHYLDCNTNEK